MTCALWCNTYFYPDLCPFSCIYGYISFRRDFSAQGWGWNGVDKEKIKLDESDSMAINKDTNLISMNISLSCFIVLTFVLTGYSWYMID